MKFFVVGISHKTSNINTREKFYLDPTERETLLNDVGRNPLISEALVISTCNRTEVYATCRGDQSLFVIHRLLHVKGVDPSSSFAEYFYMYNGQKAVRHLLSVAAGLDSLVIGEKQILGQVKLATELARKKKMLGRFLNILTNIAIRTGKKARSETKINFGGSSVSWAAVETARKRLTTLEGRSVLVIGAGKMSKLAAGDFTRKGIDKLYVMNRTMKRGEELAEKFGGIPVSFLELPEILAKVDVCISSAYAPHYIINQATVHRVMQSREEPLLMVDIAMPRNIDPMVSNIPDVQLLSLDELDRVVEHNAKQRLQASYEVERIITQKLGEFYHKINRAHKRELCRKINAGLMMQEEK